MALAVLWFIDVKIVQLTFIPYLNDTVNIAFPWKEHSAFVRLHSPFRQFLPASLAFALPFLKVSPFLTTECPQSNQLDVSSPFYLYPSWINNIHKQFSTADKLQQFVRHIEIPLHVLVRFHALCKNLYL